MSSLFLDSRRPRVSSFYFVVIYLMFANGSLATVLSGGESRGGAAFSIVWGIAYIVSAIFLARDAGGVRFYKREMPVYILAGFALVSFLWSVMPVATFTYSVSIAFNLMFALYCARFFSLDVFLKALQLCLNITIPLGLLCAAAGLEFAFYFDPMGRSNVLGVSLIKGLFSHKIYAGFYGAIAFYLNWGLMRGQRRWVFCTISMLSVMVSGSSLGIVAFLLGGAIIGLLRFFAKRKTRRSFLLPMSFAFIFVTLFSAAFYVEILGLLGRDPTLTGRTELWAWAIDFWMKSPIVGWGYAGIFGDSPDAPSGVINDDAYYQAPHFHSGYLQMLAELGLVGFSLFMWMVVNSVKGLISFYWKTEDVNFLLFSLIMVLVCCIAFAMNIFMRYNELSTLLVVYCYLSLRKLMLSSHLAEKRV
jgi:exopolysaccharide production protein ExoQ